MPHERSSLGPMICVEWAAVHGCPCEGVGSFYDVSKCSVRIEHHVLSERQYLEQHE